MEQNGDGRMLLPVQYGSQVGKGMNQGIWKDLEEKVRMWAVKRGEVYSYAGPIYEGEAIDTIGDNKVAVPTPLYKIIFDPQEEKGHQLYYAKPALKGFLYAEVHRYCSGCREEDRPELLLRS